MMVLVDVECESLSKHDFVKDFKEEARGGYLGNKPFPTFHLEEWSLEKGSSRKPRVPFYFSYITV